MQGVFKLSPCEQSGGRRRFMADDCKNTTNYQVFREPLATQAAKQFEHPHPLTSSASSSQQKVLCQLSFLDDIFMMYNVGVCQTKRSVVRYNTFMLKIALLQPVAQTQKQHCLHSGALYQSSRWLMTTGISYQRAAQAAKRMEAQYRYKKRQSI